PWMEPSLKTAALLFSHQDQITKLPPDAELLAKNDFCKIPMYSIANHIFCFQGHPEFTTKFMKDRLNARIDKLEKKTYEEAMNSLNQKSNAQEFGQWMKRFFS